MSKELEAAVTAVKAAGEVLRNGFGQHSVIWEVLLKHLLDRLLGILVRLGDEVHFSFVFDLLVLIKAVSQYLSSRLYCCNCRLELLAQTSDLSAHRIASL